jgi:SAM-dependent methyltransferase
MRGKGCYCPLCNTEYRRFLPAGVSARQNAVCPGCGSYERHRLLWIALESLKLTRLGGRLLHVAPEPCLTKNFRKAFEYLSIDLDGSRAMRAMDVTNLTLPDQQFDLVICNHVLEHIPNDGRALSELYRVMKPGAFGSIQVPMKGEVTEEDLKITDPEIRKSVYGQADHVRQYGNDFKERLGSAGFEVISLPKEKLATAQELFRLSVACENEVILVKRPLHRAS